MDQTSMVRWKRVGRGAIAFLFSCLLALVVLEIGIRLLHLVPDTIPVQYRSIAGEEDFAPLPNQEVKSLYGITHRINSLGLRDLERPLAKPPGVRRIVVLGDSFVWGFGVPFEKTFVSLLDRELAPGFQVWNLGVQATNTFNEKARFARLAPLIQPDITIIVILFNDLQPQAQHFRITTEGTLSLQERRRLFPDSWRPWLESSAVYDALIRLYGFAEGRMERYKVEDIPLLLGQLDELTRIAASNHSKLVLAVTPGVWPDTARYDKLTSALQSYARKRALPLINLEQALGRPANRRLFLKYDPVHPNAEGHRRIADQLEAALAPATR